MKKYPRFLHILLCIAGCLALNGTSVQQIPSAEITNGIVHAQIYLPDSVNGYYRGMRFDWSGVISRLEFQGHNYHGKWFDKYDPRNHDAIMGPVEEFDPLGFDTTIINGTFVKIGVGLLLKPDDKAYSSFRSYQLINAGSWKVQQRKNAITFTHVLQDPDHGYEYSKTLTLTDRKPQLIISHTLANKGRFPVRSSVYDHNFFVIDSQRTGPAYQVNFPFDNFNTGGNKGLNQVVAIEGKRLYFLRELNRGEQAYFPDLGGGKLVPYKLNVENIKSGAGVNISGDRPISKFVFWSSATTVCPEPYIDLDIAPGKSFSWKIMYDYYINKAPINKL